MSLADFIVIVLMQRMKTRIFPAPIAVNSSATTKTPTIPTSNPRPTLSFSVVRASVQHLSKKGEELDLPGDVSINVSQDVVRPIVEAKIQAAIVTELEKDQNLVYKMVQAALGQKVDEQGRISQYSSDNKFSYVERLCSNAIQEAAKVAMQEYIRENADLLKEAVKEQIGKQGKDLAAAFVAGLVKCAETDWRFKCDVTLDNRER